MPAVLLGLFVSCLAAISSKGTMAASTASRFSLSPVANVSQQARTLVPAWSVPFHKGQHGRVLVVGGSFEYTGAPYYAAESSLRCGADLSFVACGKDAASAIKAYSPELIVHELLPSSCSVVDSSAVAADGSTSREGVSAVRELLPGMSALVLGPGLGRHTNTMQAVHQVLLDAQQASLPTVIDADGLWFAKEHPTALLGARGTVLTPNVPELARLKRALQENDDTKHSMRDMQEWLDAAAARGDSLPSSTDAALVSHALGGVAVLAKGPTDSAVLVQKGDGVTVHWADVSADGSPRRCGGQGDVLAGSLGTFLSWAHMRPKKDKSGWEKTQPEAQRIVAAMAAASTLTRASARRAFAAGGRSTTTPDIIQHLGAAFAEEFEDTMD